MKSFRILSAVLAMSLLVFTGCVKETIHTGIDGNKPGISQLTYEGVTHGGKTVTLKWSGAEAVAAGATSFSVQFVENTDTTGGKLIKPDMYNTTLSKTVQVEPDEEGVVPSEYSATMDGQTVGKKYYIRVRANYPMSVYSDWTWLTTAEGNPAYFKVGRGVITEGIEDPYLYKVTGTSKGLIIKWDELPDAIGYQIEYKKSDESNWTVETVPAGGQTVLKIDNLPSETSFDVRAKTLTLSGDSEYCDVQTVSTRKPGSFPKEMKDADEFIAWLEGGVVEVGDNETFTITDDIDLSGQAYTAMDESLLGTFDGGGHTIKGVSSPLFYEVETSGAIKNVTVEGEIAGDGERLAAIALKNKGTISDVTAKVDVTFDAAASSQMLVAGIVAENEGTLTNVKNEGNVTASAKSDIGSAIVMGGIAAYSAGPITASSNKGAVKFTGTVIKGIAIAGAVGYLENLLDDVSNEGSVTATATYANGKCQVVNTANGTPAVAGIAAYGASDNFHIKGCTNYGAVSYSLTAIEKYTAANLNRNQFAGIVANPNGLVEDCVNNGALSISVKSSKGEAFTGSGHEHIVCVGGIGGGDYFPSSQAITDYKNCTNNGNIIVDSDAAQANSAIGGICGWPGKEDTSRTNGTFNCTNNGRVTLKGLGKGRIGGIHGGSGIIDGCKNTGEIRLEGGVAACVAGGLAGFSSNGFKIVNSESSGNVTAEFAAQGVGGILGNAGNQANSGRNFTGCTVACVVRNGEATNEYTGMVLGYYNGATTFVGIGTEESPIPVRGKIVLGGVVTKMAAGNVKTYAAGTKNPSADNHPVFVVFDPTPFDEGGSDEPDQPKLDAPSNVKVDVFYNYTTVSWDAVNGAEWYVVEYKKADATSWTACDRTEETSYKIEGLEHGVAYNFRVKAFTSNGSGYSDEAQGDTLPEVILGKPVITGATMSPKSADLAWNAVENATAYRVEVKGPEDEDWRVVAESVADTHFLVEGLKPETAYQFRVKALGEGGNEGEEFSDPYSATTEAVTFSYPLTLDNVNDFATWVNVAAELAPETAVVTLASDMDLKGIEITPIKTFAGTLDGAGKTIKNFSGSNGLIASLSGTVKNLNIDSASSIEWTEEIPDETGIAFIAAKSTGSILDCNVAGKIKVLTGTAGRVFCAGVVGLSSTGYVEGCKFTGSIDVELTGGSKSCSAIAGVAARVGHADMAGKTIVKDCVNEGAIKFTYSGPSTGMQKFGIGGVVGQTPSLGTNAGDHGIIEGCTNRGNIDWIYPAGGKGSYPALGGVAGIVEGVLKNANNYGKLSFTGSKDVAVTDASIGGVAGYVTGGASDCHNYGTLKLDSGFAGGTSLAQSGGNTSFSTFGGVFGNVGPYAADNTNTNDKDILVENISNEADIELDANMVQTGGPKMCFGGAIGASTAKLKNVVNKKSVTITTQTKTMYAGGVVGYLAADAEGVINNGAVILDGKQETHPTGIASEQAYLGGVAGYVIKNVTLTNCQNTGAVTLQNLYTTPGALSYVGGINGSYQGGITMEGCENSGVITNKAEAPLCLGGISGAFNGTMSNTKNSGKVSNASSYLSPNAGKEPEVGGIAGYSNANYTGCQNTGDIDNAAAGFSGGFIGGNGDDANGFNWTNDLVNCSISGASTAGAVLGRFRNADKGNNLNLGGEGTPFTIQGAAASLPLCGDPNGSNIIEVNVVK